MSTAPALYHSTVPDRGPFLTTFSGRRFYFTDPRPEDIHIGDIAHALSQLCRFTGHCREFYSVAQHSFHASLRAPWEHKLSALMHDAAEAYIGDVSSPLKQVLGSRYGDLDENINIAIAERFGLPHPLPAAVKRIDIEMLVLEARALLHDSSGVEAYAASKGVFSDHLDADALHSATWSPEVARMAFRTQFELLTKIGSKVRT